MPVRCPTTVRRLFTHREQKSRHMLLYSHTIPAMIPIFLLGSAVYLGLQLTHLHLSHGKYLEEASQRIKQLEAEIQTLQTEGVILPEPRQHAKPSKRP